MKDDTYNTLLQDEDPPFLMYKKRLMQTTYSVYINDSIDASTKWFKLMHKLRNAENIDKFILYLNNFGGDVHVGLQLIHAMKESPATIITVVDGNCYSMGSIICLASDMMIWSGTSSRLMFHNCSDHHVGKGKELFDAVIESRESWRAAITEYCIPFLTDEEIEDLMDDKDVYIKLDGQEECIARCKRQFPEGKQTYKIGKQYAPSM